jgi:serine/threonine protein kinase/tetratricopeptide (TPR) repeat protein
LTGQTDSAGLKGLPIIRGYEVETELGRGGMGVVYLARQVRANRLVALKMMLPQASDDERERFLLEAQAIAEIDHPNIIKVYDVAEVDNRPYFAMEYCPGGSLAGRLDGTPWTSRSAVETIVKLARGIAAAHAKGIIHRDLKPANILIQSPNQDSGLRNSSKSGTKTQEPITDPESAPRDGISSSATRPSGDPASSSRLTGGNDQFKITDFGLAKRLDSDDGRTRTGAIMGTPNYMAPEQARGESSQYGTSTDVYSLGVILYELLTGHPPFRGATIIDTLDLVRNSEAISVKTLIPQTPKDIDTICTKCLRKDPQKRYPDAASLADDLERWLNGRPIEARPVDWLERTFKWINRNRGIAAGLAVGFLALFFGALIAFWQWREAVSSLNREREARLRADQLAKQNQKLAEDQKALAEKELKARQEADAEALRAGQVTDFLSSMFKASNPLDIFGSNVIPPSWEEEQRLTARDFLDRAAERAKTGLKEVPLARAKLLLTIGSSYRNLGLFAKAEPLLEEAMELRKKHLPENHPDLGQSHFEMGGFYHDLGDFLRADREYQAALKVQEACSAPEEEKCSTLFYIASCQGMIGHPSAKPLLIDLVKQCDAKFGPHHRLSVLARGYLLAVMIDRHEEKELLFLETNAAFLEGVEAQPSEQVKLLGRLAREFQAALIAQKSSESIPFELARKPVQQSAIDKFLAALELCRKGLPPDNGFATLVRFEYARALETQGNEVEAEKQFLAVVESIRKTTGFAHPRTMVVLGVVTDFLARRKRVDEARKLFQEALASNSRGFGDDNFWKGTISILWARFEFDFGEEKQAIALSRQIAVLGDKNRLVATPHLIHDLYQLALEFVSVSGNDQSIGLRLIDHAHRLTKQTLDETDWHRVGNLRVKSYLQRMTGRWDESETTIREAQANASKIPDLPLYQQQMLAMEHAFVHQLHSRFAEAEKEFGRAREIARKLNPAKNHDRRQAALNVMLPLVSAGKYREAIPFALEAERERGFNWTNPRARYQWDRRLAILELKLGNPAPLRELLQRLEVDFRKSPTPELFALFAQAGSLLPGDFSVDRWRTLLELAPLAKSEITFDQIDSYSQAFAGCGDFPRVQELRRTRFNGNALDEELLARESLSKNHLEEAKFHLSVADEQAKMWLPRDGKYTPWGLDTFFDDLEGQLRRAAIREAISHAEKGREAFPERLRLPTRQPE